MSYSIEVSAVSVYKAASLLIDNAIIYEEFSYSTREFIFINIEFYEAALQLFGRHGINIINTGNTYHANFGMARYKKNWN